MVELKPYLFIRKKIILDDARQITGNFIAIIDRLQSTHPASILRPDDF